MSFSAIIDVVGPAFVMLFVIVDPIGAVPMFAALTGKARPDYRRQMAFRSCIVGFLVMLFFGICGKLLLASLGITIPAFRIAGGIMLFIVAIEMVFSNKQGEKEASDEAGHYDVSVFPLAIPLLAGPGSIAAMILLMGNQTGHYFNQLLVVLTTLTVFILCLALFLLSEKLVRVMTKTVNNVITRVLGIILAAMAVQFIVDGIWGAIKLNVV